MAAKRRTGLVSIASAISKNSAASIRRSTSLEFGYKRLRAAGAVRERLLG